MVLRQSVNAGTTRPPSNVLHARLPALAGAALVAVLCSISGAQADCTTTLPSAPNPLFGLGIGPPVITPTDLLPIGQGGAVNSLVSVLNTVNTAFLTNSSAFVSAPGNPRPDQQGGGSWARTILGNVENQNTGVTTVDGIAGATNCHTTTTQDFVGFQAGHEIALLNGGKSGANWHVGVTAGYFEAHAKDATAGGTFRGDFEVPFAGLYTVYTKGNFFADGLLRLDAYQNNLTDPANGLRGQRLDARGVSATGNVGYRVDLPSRWFIEPSAGLIWSRVNVDPINVPGTLVTLSGLAAPGTVQIDDIESVLGRLSLRIGTSFTSGSFALQPFFTASVLREFAGDVHTNFATCFGVFNTGCGSFGPGTELNATLSTSRVGTYAQLGVGLAGQLLNTGWLGYARVDYRTGDNIESVSGNIGLRYQFTPNEAERGGLKDAPARDARPYNWNGLYAGWFSGKMWGQEEWRYTNFGSTVHPDFAGYIFGGQVGYNIQSGRWVYGVEADLGSSNASGGKSCPNGFFFTCEAEMDWLGSVTGRLGYTWERALFYVKGGLAVGEVTAEGSPNLGPFAPVLGTSTSKTLTGWTVGTGIEFALTDKWSAKAEYTYFDLGSATYLTDLSAGGGGLVDAKTHGSTVRIGTNYHFGR